jgi:hypothetical protein
LSKPKYVEFPVGINKKCLDDVCYELDRSTDTLTMTLEGSFYNFPKERAPRLINRFGLKKISTVRKISIILAMTSFILSLFYLFQEFWSLAVIMFLAGMIFISICEDLTEVKNYYIISKCKNCGRDFAYEEIKKPLIKKVSTYDSYEETETRYFKCKYCNDEDLKTKSLLKSSKSRRRRDPTKGKTCKKCGKEYALIEYRYPDTHLESLYIARTIRHYKCKSCGYMEISIKDEATSTD